MAEPMIFRRRYRALLFVFDESCTLQVTNPLDLDYDLIEHRPTLLKMKLSRFRGLKDFLIHFSWYIFTKGQYRIIYGMHRNEIIHYSYVIPKYARFAFMSKDDLEIGPCFTEERYRGKGIYPAVIIYIIKRFRKKDRKFFLFAGEDNVSSQKGCLKTGMIEGGCVHKDFIGTYRKD